MKRVWISVGILSVMILMSGIFCYRISLNCDRLIEIVQDTEENVRLENMEEALKNAYEFENQFENFHKESILMINGEKLSEIENCCIRIVPLIETENDELLPELAELKNILIHLKKSEIPTLNNIL